MKLTKSDLIPYQEYQKLHDKFLKEVIEEKKVLRVNISDKMSGLFETKLTVFYQIQEMIRAEQISDPTYIEEMLNVYNELLPDKNELSMTLFIEIPVQEDLRAFNKTIVGIENHVQLLFDNIVITSYEPDDEEKEEENYTQSVHYLHFPFTEEQKDQFLNANQVTLKVNHPNYQVEKELPDELIQKLQEQLSKN
ncbi:DUF3501 family protein [Tepidibacillus fermentans]|uniref:Uncharacterized protein DUF3501 n=1 Tax=Tepidibacillus fermentans TaxID=1281767 RepID=A0A4R3KHY3_9BACI|nr:DUF3501 family protein [Tepidibacillus fermentans]TCS83105.1 uncharacterized protein DUF3501 [Tepidibacillus fermentans]